MRLLQRQPGDLHASGHVEVEIAIGTDHGRLVQLRTEPILQQKGIARMKPVSRTRMQLIVGGMKRTRESNVRLRRLSRLDYQDHSIDRGGYTKCLSRPPQRRAIDQDEVEA